MQLHIFTSRKCISLVLQSGILGFNTQFVLHASLAPSGLERTVCNYSSQIQSLMSYFNSLGHSSDIADRSNVNALYSKQTKST